MPSTYTTNNGIELIATGEQSGTWGDTTNTNLELLDASLDGQVTVTLSAGGSSGSPNDLPVTNGAASNGRNRLVIFNDGGDLGGTAYVRLTPNDAEKIIFIRNALTASRSILVFQGTYSASNDYEIPNGTTGVLYFNGAGSGAVAANVFNNAVFDGVSVDTISEKTSGSGVTIDTVLLKDDVVNATDVETTRISANDGTTAINIANSTGAVDIDTSLNVDGTVTDDGATHDGDVTFTGASYNVVWDKSDNSLEFADNAKATFGAGGDLSIYHDGSNSYINDTATGNLKLAASQVDILGGTDGAETMATFVDNGAATLYHDNTARIATTSAGVDVTGTVTMDGGSTSADFSFGDSDKALFGAGNDLQIYHDGSDSIIADEGTGRLLIDASTQIIIRGGTASEWMFRGVEDGAVELYYDNGKKLATTSAGVDVTGTVTMDGGSTSANFSFGDNDKALFGAGNDLEIYHNGAYSLVADVGTGNLIVAANDLQLTNADVTENYLRAYANGTVELYYDSGKKLETTSSGIHVTDAVGVGAAPAAGTQLYISHATQPTIRLQDSGGTNQYGQMYHNSGLTYFSSRNASSHGQFYWATYNGTDLVNRMHLSASGVLTVTAGITASSGVYLGGTGSENLLDDYEEGDWTPDIRQSGTAVSDAAYNTSFTAGQYTKTGRLVSVSASLRLTDKGTVTSSNAFQIGGLPFVSTNNVKARAAASVYNHSGGVIDTSGNKNGTLTGLLTHNADEITFAVIDLSDGSSEAVQYADVPDDLYIQISLAYITG